MISNITQSYSKETGFSIMTRPIKNRSSILVLATMTLSLMLSGAHSFGNAATSKEADCYDTYSFAKHLMTKGDYYRAISEFERYIFHCPEGDLFDSAKENIGRSLLLAERYNLVLDWHQGLNREEQSNDKYVLIKATALFRKGQYAETLESLDLTDLRDLNPGEKAYSSYIKGLSSVYLEQWDNAKKYFMNVPDDSPFKDRANKYHDILLHSTSYPQKSSRVAGLLSIVPGLGYAYLGHYHTAVASLVVNSLLFWAAYDSFDDDKEAQGITISIFFAGFYIGNITGSIQSTDRYNAYEYRMFHDRFVE